VPIYEYQCTKCGEVFEAFQRISDEPLTQCKFCQSAVEKLISHSSFQLKGSGWYLTDYSHKNSSPATDARNAGGSAASTSGSENSEKKSETKAASSESSSSTSTTTTSA
jgi:putative FmdB family regulatory protein